MKVEKKLKELGIDLPKATTPMGSYVNAVRTGNLLYLAGKGPGLPGHPLPVGKVGRDFTVEEGYEHARSVGISILAALKAELGDLDKVKRVVKVLGMVNAVRPPCPIGGWHGLATARHSSRDRGDRRA